MIYILMLPVLSAVTLKYGYTIYVFMKNHF